MKKLNKEMIDQLEILIARGDKEDVGNAIFSQLAMHTVKIDELVEAYNKLARHKGGKSKKKIV